MARDMQPILHLFPCLIGLLDAFESSARLQILDHEFLVFLLIADAIYTTAQGITCYARGMWGYMQ
jgi:hypothetical protein